MRKRYNDFEPIPFWFLNDDFDKEEIAFQLDIMKDKGVKGCFLHVRDGITEAGYGTAIFFENIRFIVERAKERGIDVWLYDEDSYPSGNLGGKIVIDRPELQAHALKVIKLDGEKGGIVRKVLGRVKGLFGYVVKRDNGAEKVDILDECFGPIRRNWYKAEVDRVYCSDLSDLHYKHLRAETNYTEIIFEAEVPRGSEVYVAYLEPVFIDQRFYAKADCLNSDTAKIFIENTHEKYRKYVGEYFGSAIKGIFLDEPSVGGILPYTDKLNERFIKDFGYNAENFYYKLCADYTGDGAEFRRNYAQTCTNLFHDNFLAPIKRWCEANGLIMAGHFGGEESLFGQMLSGQNIYRNSRIMGLCGCDIISYNIGSAKRPMLMSGENIAVSAATHEKKGTVLAECFALCPYDAGYPVLKRTGDWLFVNGINKLVPHAFYYGYSAFQRADAGKSYFYQDAKFDEYLKFAEYAGRCCKILHEYKRDNDVLAVIPYGALSEEIPLPYGHTGIKSNGRVQAIENDYFRFIGSAAKVQLGVDCADAKAVYDAEITDGKVCIGDGRYVKVVLFSDGDEEKRLYEYLLGKNVDAEFYRSDLAILCRSERFCGDTDDLICYRKVKSGGELLFLFNDSERYCEFGVATKGNAYVYVYDAEEDETYSLDSADGKVLLALNAYNSVFLLFSESPIKGVNKKYRVQERKPFNPDDFGNFSLTYRPKGMRTAVEEWRLITTKGLKQTFTGKVKWCRLRDVLGTQDDIYKNRYKIPFFDRAPRPDGIYPQKAVFETEIDCVDKSDYVLTDKWTFSGNYELYFNGRKVEKSEFFAKRVYDKSNEGFYPKWKDGKNKITVVFENGGEFDGINGELYVMKNDSI